MSETTENVSALSDDIGGLAGSVLSLSERAVALERALAAAERELAGVRKALRAVEGLMEESQGVYGLHLNGDTSPWSELRTGGRFEEWLAEFDAALGNAPPEVPDTPREATDPNSEVR